MTTDLITKAPVVTAPANTIHQVVTKTGGNSWFGRTVTSVGQFFQKIWRAIADFFRNFPSHIRTGFGIGSIGIAAGTVAVIGFNFSDNKAVRIGGAIAGAAIIAASTALMVAFKGNPVTFARTVAA